MAELDELRAYVEYFRDLGVYDFYRRGDGSPSEAVAAFLERAFPAPTWQPSSNLGAPPRVGASPLAGSEPSVSVLPSLAGSASPAFAGQPPWPNPLEVAVPKPVPFNDLAPLPLVRVPPADRAAALEQLRREIGDCTRCPLAYAGRHTIVFGQGDPAARLMFVGEGPGADEDASGLPFVGKAGQLLNNMIAAMGLRREDVYIANIVKCRPPANRVPEPVEANTCSQFLLQQMDIVQPEIVVALGATAATYLLGVKQSLATLRSRFHICRGSRLLVTFHPAFLLRDPRQKGEAWKDLQLVMAELGLKPPAKL